MKVKFCLLVVLLCCCQYVLSQEDFEAESAVTADIITLYDENEAETVIENLAILSENPVMINSGDEEEVARLFFLTEFQVKVLADHVMHHQMITTIYEIATLPGFDRNTAVMISPYVSLDASPESKSVKGSSKSLTAMTFIKLPSDNNDETGVRTLLRYRHKAGTISFGMTAENDPGEQYTFKDAMGPDFLSGYLMYDGSGFLKRVVAGDYSLRFGEGVTFNNNSWQGSRLVSPSFMTGRIVAGPYASTEENNFFRGIACVLGKITNGIVLFVSSNDIDARVAYSQEENSYFISNLVKGGQHNTESGLAARNALTENLAGVHVSGGTGHFRGGITASMTHFSVPFKNDTLNAKTIFDFNGDRLYNLGADLKVGTGKILFFSEAAYSIPGSLAGITGIRVTPVNRITFNLLVRHYSANYYSFHSKAFSSGSTVSNETGVAGNIHLEAARHLFISAGVDLYRSPWIRYRSSAPSTGSRTELTCDFSPDDDLNMRLSIATTDREYDLDEDTGLPAAARQRRTLVSAQFRYSPAENIRLTTRGMYCSLQAKNERGYMLNQDMLLSMRHLPFRVWFRFSLFSTGSYDTRLYALENDMLQSFSMPALYGEGSRAYMMLSWKPFRSMELRVKYGVTVKNEGNERGITREFRMQGKIVF